jgi:predicted metal-dependent phosphoesterase TrpH
MTWTLVQHVHTRHSFDSMADPTALVRHAASQGVHVLVVTDHDTWQGSVEARAAAAREQLDLHVVLATERNTDQGDLIGMFLTEDIAETNALAFCDAVHAQGGLVSLPHPYKWHRLSDELLERVDLIEVYNARCTPWDNSQAEALARDKGKQKVVGPDAHRVGELMLARIEFEGDRPNDEAGIRRALFEAPRKFVTRRPSIWNEWRSQAVRFWRQPSFALGVALARGAAIRLIDPGRFGRA